MLLLLACKKEKISNKDDRFVEHNESLSALEASISSAGKEFLELQWSLVTNTHYKEVTYSVFLDGIKVSEGITTTKFSLINLKPDHSYTVKVVASVANGMNTDYVLTGKTLADTGAPTFYKEYNIHSFSSMVGSTALQRCADGSHLVARFLSHPAAFGGDSMKIVLFKLDDNGNMLWYRLLSADALKTNSMAELILALHNGDREAILLVGGIVTKVNLSTGEVLSTRDYSGQFPNQSFRSAYYTSSQELIAGGNNGALVSINPTDLTLNWSQTNLSRSGSIIAIAIDSKKNIYYIFNAKNDEHTQIRVDKCDPIGNFLTSFSFDGILPNEGNWGFSMNALVVDAEDNFYMFGHNYDYNFLRYFKFNTAGVTLKKNNVSDYLIAKSAFINSKGEIVVAGRTDGGSFNTAGTIYVFDKDLNIKTKETYSNLPYHIIRGVTGNPDGSYNIFLNYMQTYTYDNRSFVFIKTDANGKI
ncbi:MAG: hypothetical protein EOO42_02045 [Flavobacteriales bacterium]|nr:MAG: hypothetical protein EOO42_02045 [Flavobacteriales bacterium]